MGRFDKECKEAEGSKQGIMQLNVTLLIVEEKRESKLKSTAFQLLKQYQHYREDKKIRNLQLYQWQDRKTATKAMRGLRRYHNMLDKFGGYLQLVYCRHLMSRCFEAIKEYRLRNPRKRDILVEMVRKKGEKRKIRELLDGWRMYALNKSRNRRLFWNGIANIVKCSDCNSVRLAFYMLKYCGRKVSDSINNAQISQYPTYYLFEFKRKYVPIRDVGLAKRTDRTPSKRPTSPALSRQSSIPGGYRRAQVQQYVRSSEAKLRILRQLILLKYQYVEYFGDVCFNDPMYEQYKTKLRLDLGHYLIILEESRRD